MKKGRKVFQNPDTLAEIKKILWGREEREQRDARPGRGVVTWQSHVTPQQCLPGVSSSRRGTNHRRPVAGPTPSDRAFTALSTFPVSLPSPCIHWHPAGLSPPMRGLPAPHRNRTRARPIHASASPATLSPFLTGSTYQTSQSVTAEAVTASWNPTTTTTTRHQSARSRSLLAQKGRHRVRTARGVARKQPRGLPCPALQRRGEEKKSEFFLFFFLSLSCPRGFAARAASIGDEGLDRSRGP